MLSPSRHRIALLTRRTTPLFIGVVICLLVPIISPAQAEIISFTRTVRQPFYGSQSPEQARATAVAKAKQAILEEAGMYLERLSVVKDGVSARDEVLALAAGIVRSRVVAEEKYHTPDVYGIAVTVRADVDTSVLAGRVDRLLQDREHLRKLEQAQTRIAELLKHNKELEKRFARLPASSHASRNENLSSDLAQNARALNAAQWTDKALALWDDGRYSDPDAAIRYLTSAIAQDPNQAAAYHNRGAAYANLGLNEKAISDFTKAIQLNPGDATAHYNRATASFALGKYRDALDDATEAIAIRQDSPRAYACRAIARLRLGDASLAAEDCTEAIRLDPTLARAYYNRFQAYQAMGKTRLAQRDYEKAVQLEPGLARARRPEPRIRASVLDSLINSVLGLLVPILGLMFLASVFLPRRMNPIRLLSRPFTSSSGFWTGFWVAVWTSSLGRWVLAAFFLVGLGFILALSLLPARP